jgi:hypothetical protein
MTRRPLSRAGSYEENDMEQDQARAGSPSLEDERREHALDREGGRAANDAVLVSFVQTGIHLESAH